MEKKNSFFDIGRFEGGGNTWFSYLKQGSAETKENPKIISHGGGFNGRKI